MASSQRQMFEKQREASRQVLEKEYKIQQAEKEVIDQDLSFLQKLSKPKAEVQNVSDSE